MNKRRTSMWISRHALSVGVVKKDGIVDGKYFHDDDFLIHRIGRDAHENSSEAVIAAQRMKEKAIKSLKDQLSSIESKQIEVRS